MAKKKCTNPHAFSVLLSLTLGWGLWLVPEVFSAFGWAAAVIIIAASAAATWLSGSLYGQLCSAVPHAASLSEVGRRAHGRAEQRSAAAFVMLTQVLMCLVLQQAAATSLQQALLHTANGRTISLWLAQLAVGAVLLAAVQLRHLAHLSWLCYGGNLAQLLAACLLSAGLLVEAKSRSAGPHGAAVPQEACLACL